MDTTNIQTLINKKAEKKLEAELSGLHKVISNHPLFKYPSNRQDVPQLLTSGHKAIWPSELLTVNHPFREELKQFWLPIYIERETEEFLNSVKVLQSQVSDLMDAEFEHHD